MSHVISAKGIYEDLDILQIALKKFPQFQWREGQKTHVWFGEWVDDYRAADAAFKSGIKPEDYGKCDHAIHMNGVNYEIGVVKRADGLGYSLVWDFFSDGQRISDYIGQGGEKLLVAYEEEVLRQGAQRNGMMVNCTEEENFLRVELLG